MALCNFREEDTDPNFDRLPRGPGVVEIRKNKTGNDEDHNDGTTPEGDLETKRDQLQTFVFSATLSRDLQQNLKKRKRIKPGNRKRKSNGKPETTLGRPID